MTIVTINGSPRKRGNTATAAALLAGRLQERLGPGTRVKMVHLGGHDLRMCRGCRVCFDRGEERCPLRDDLLKVKKTLDSADLVILAAPVYVEDVSGLLKNWLNRMAFVCHRPQYTGKTACLLTTSGVGSTGHALRTMNTALRTWGFAVAGSGMFHTGEAMDAAAQEARFGKRFDKLAAAVAARTLRPRRPGLLALLTFRIQQLYHEKFDARDSLDYRFWQERGWLDKHRRWYTKERVPRLRAAMARLLGGIIARLVLR